MRYLLYLLEQQNYINRVALSYCLNTQSESALVREIRQLRNDGENVNFLVDAGTGAVMLKSNGMILIFNNDLGEFITPYDGTSYGQIRELKLWPRDPDWRELNSEETRLPIRESDLRREFGEQYKKPYFGYSDLWRQYLKYHFSYDMAPVFASRVSGESDSDTDTSARTALTKLKSISNGLSRATSFQSDSTSRPQDFLKESNSNCCAPVASSSVGFVESEATGENINNSSALSRQPPPAPLPDPCVRPNIASTEGTNYRQKSLHSH